MALLIVDRHIKVKKTQLFKKKVVSIKMICWCKHFPSTIKISRYFYCARCLGRWICWWHRLSWSTRREFTRGITFFFISCQLIVVWGRSEDVNLSMWTSPGVEGLNGRSRCAGFTSESWSTFPAQEIHWIINQLTFNKTDPVLYKNYSWLRSSFLCNCESRETLCISHNTIDINTACAYQHGRTCS